MISRMKKVTVICIREHQEATLLALQQMGVLHLEHIEEPAGTLLEETRAHLLDVRRACEVLGHYHQLAEKEGTGVPAIDPDRTAESVVDEIWKLISQRKDFEESLDHWQREIARVAPFGSFDPAQITALKANHLYINLYQAGPKQIVEVPDSATLTIHQQDRDGCYFSVISREPLELPYETVKLPRVSLQHMQVKVEELQAALRDNEKSFCALAGYLDEVRDIVAHAEDKVHFLEARTGMGGAEPLAYLRGYCVERDVERIRAGAKALGWGILVEDPKADDRAPTKIENPKWVQPIRVVFNFIGVVPGYDEVDISAVFLLFFSLFFAMIVGDAGYGLLFLGATFWAHRKFKQAPASVFHLLYITSIATIIWGVLSSNFFGLTALARDNWFTQTENLMLLCFLIGAIHLTIAHTWNVIRNRYSLQALAQIGWIGIVWTMFFLARFLVLNKEFPVVMVPVFCVGLVLLVLFMTPASKLKSEWFNHVMLPLNLVSNFVDVVSYVRLFAVGTATLAVASAFNQMAVDVGAGGWLGQFFAVLIILLGHTLNILLAAMGVLVHGIRLNTLEFAGHLGLQWTGIRFMPFMQKSRRAPLLDDEMEQLEQR